MLRVIKRGALVAFWSKRPVARQPLVDWYEKVCAATWASFADVRATFRHADLARVDSGRSVAIFNIGGNKFRLIAAIHYNTRIVYVLRILTHKQYDQDDWKREL